MRGLLTSLKADRPTTREALLALLSATPPPTLIAGGTDVMVRLEAGGQKPDERFVDLGALDGEFRRLSLDDDALEIGPLATYWETRLRRDITREFPLLEEAARTVGAVQIQSRGTWAGNIANGSPAADGVAALLALDADVVLLSKRGSRVRPLHGFFTGYKEMDRREGEMIAAIRIPRRGPNRAEGFLKVGTRRAQAITKVGLTYAHRADGSWRIVGTSLAPIVTRYPAIEAVLEQGGGPATLAASLDAAVQQDVRPIDDIRSTADYRRTVFRRLLGSITP